MDENLIYNKPITAFNMLVFAVPTTIRMVFISLYTTVDGIVVSNCVGSMGLSAINIVYPVLNVNMALAFMFATGSNALTGKMLGEGKRSEASRFMTLTVLLNIALVMLIMAVFFIWDESIYLLLGSDEELLPYCVEYGTIMVALGPVWTLQILFQGYLVTADKPGMGLWLSVCSGVINVILDVTLVGCLDMGLAGAALASGAGMAVGGIAPLFVFFSRKSLIHFEKPAKPGIDVFRALGNGTSEMVSSLSSAVTTAMFNIQMMSIAGEKGVAAISALFYMQFLFVTVFIGFTSGIAPVVSYNYGAGNRENIRRIFAIAIRVIIAASVVMFLLAEVLDKPMTMIFASSDTALASLMISGFKILAISILLCGLNIFASGYFTALNNGRISAIISFLRTFAFQVGVLILLPAVLGIDGIWWTLPCAELLSAAVAVPLLVKYRKQYGY
ncbi:MAG: MATE family efflux transporter [Firmicutes bacterium]|nr:MATE family efflux transporter [Bacillota bacterium]